jgi:hypothetical protein
MPLLILCRHVASVRHALFVEGIAKILSEELRGREYRSTVGSLRCYEHFGERAQNVLCRRDRALLAIVICSRSMLRMTRMTLYWTPPSAISSCYF